ncbi:hypothetical protein QQF64_010588 [Cirrhinus molitorella]|uniref:Uncharacterized protein n=1 Tax=Cirrhinus molitorella TaxID=172907 RepID=A0ABR3LWT6_9TELE
MVKSAASSVCFHSEQKRVSEQQPVIYLNIKIRRNERLPKTTECGDAQRGRSTLTESESLRNPIKSVEKHVLVLIWNVSKL